MPTFKVALLQESTGEGPEHQWWVAVGVDHYVACQARTREGVLAVFERLIVGRAVWAKRHGKEISLPGPAPAKTIARALEITEVHVDLETLRLALHREEP